MEADLPERSHIILKVMFRGLLQRNIGSTAEMSAWIAKATTSKKTAL